MNPSHKNSSHACSESTEIRLSALDACPLLACRDDLRELRNSGECPQNALEQQKASVPHLACGIHDHHLVEESVNMRAQSRDRFQRSHVVAPF